MFHHVEEIDSLYHRPTSPNLLINKATPEWNKLYIFYSESALIGQSNALNLDLDILGQASDLDS
jgi:hypothetical protein